ncbi:hypothetical protein ABZ883_14990 [Streptomyces sp. NPDC046977]|uniref:hypothetical protein n=1 Tax=Streptomyces sp. NPDC046977 TaxID=3154703 RepID=UPI0033E6F82A
MRPQRFEDTLKALLQQSGGQVKKVAPARDAGWDRNPFGLAVTYQTGARVLLQIIATSADGEKYDQPEGAPAEGETALAPVPVPDVFDSGKVQLGLVDQHLAALLVNSGSRELARVEAYSSEPEAHNAIKYGVRATYHDGSRINVYVVHALPAGRSDWPRGGEFSVPFAV